MSASARVDGVALTATEALAAAKETFTRANQTLSGVNGALVTGDRALAAAANAFTSADRVMNEEIGEISSRLRATLTELERAVAAVAGDIPGLTQELRSASRSAQAAFAEIEDAVGRSSPAVRRFAATELPEFGRLAAEMRTLVQSLDALVDQVRRDPSRFLLNPRNPEFRR